MIKIEKLIGKNKASDEVKDLISTIKEPYKTSRFNDSYYQCYKESGIELAFNKEHYLQSVIFHYNGCDVAELQQVSLPYDLHLSDSRRVIEDKLGVPERQGEPSESFNFWTCHPEYGLTITYSSFSKDDYEAAIKHICFSKPETEIDRLKFLNKTDIYSYLQVYSKIYTPGILTELLRTKPSRASDLEGELLSEDERMNGYHFWEYYLTENEHLSLKSQFKTALVFVNEIESIIEKLKGDCLFKLKFSINSLRSNSTHISIDTDTSLYLSKLGIGIDFEFNT